MTVNATFLTIGERTYRVYFPGMLEGFERTALQEDNQGERFDSDLREYYILGYKAGNASFDIHVREVGSDLEPARIEAWFSSGDKKIEPPIDVIERIWERNEEKSKGRTLVYVNGKVIG